MASIFVSSPFVANGGYMFRLADRPVARWERLRDPNGKPIPLEIFVDNTGNVFERWIL